MDEMLTFYGGAVKALDDRGRVGGYLVSWGSPAQKDASGEYFTKDTYLGPVDGDNSETLFHHSQPIKGAEKFADYTFEPARTKRDDVGIWAETVLNMADDYERKVFELVKMGKLGWSSGSSPHRVRKSADGHITSWPISECSLTPEPCEPRHRGGIIPLKSLPPIEFKFMGTSDAGAGGTLVPQPGRDDVWKQLGEAIDESLGRPGQQQQEETKMNIGTEYAGKTFTIAGKTFKVNTKGIGEPCENPLCDSCGEPHPNCRCYKSKKSKKTTLLGIKSDGIPLGQQTLEGTHAHLTNLAAEVDAITGQIEPGAEVANSLGTLGETLNEAVSIVEDAHAAHYPDAEPLKSTKRDYAIYEGNREEVGVTTGESHKDDDGEIIGHNIGPVRVSLGAAKGDGSETDYEVAEEENQSYPGSKSQQDDGESVEDEEAYAEEYKRMTPEQKAWVDREIKAINRLAAQKRLAARHENRKRKAFAQRQAS